MSPVSKPASLVRVLRASEPAQRKTWGDLLDGAPSPDAYYRSGYAFAYEGDGQGSAVAVVVQSGPVRLLFPLLLVPLTDLRFTHLEVAEPGARSRIQPPPASLPVTESAGDN